MAKNVVRATRHVPPTNNERLQQFVKKTGITITEKMHRDDGGKKPRKGRS